MAPADAGRPEICTTYEAAPGRSAAAGGGCSVVTARGAQWTFGRIVSELTRYQLTVFPPGISESERRRIRLARWWPMWAAPVWIICQVVAGELTGPWEALAISTACYLGLGLAAVVMAGDQRRQVRTIDAAVLVGYDDPESAETVHRFKSPLRPASSRPIPACRMAGCRLLSTSSSGGVCTTRWKEDPSPPAPSGASQERVLRRQPGFGECAQRERLGIAQPIAPADGILDAHEQIAQLMNSRAVSGFSQSATWLPSTLRSPTHWP